MSRLACKSAAPGNSLGEDLHQAQAEVPKRTGKRRIRPPKVEFEFTNLN